MKFKNKVDLIIPVYGPAHYLLDTINSIKENDLINQIIFILDRADKNVREVIKKNTLMKYRIVESLEPGITNALNLGLQESKSEYIARIDADDKMTSNRISRQLEILERHNEVGLVASNYYKISETGKILSVRRTEFNQNDLKKLLVFKNFIAHPTVMYRKSLVLSVGGYRSQFEGAEDYDLWLRLISKTEFKVISEPLTYYRLSKFQYTNRLKNLRSELDKAVRISYLLSEHNQFANYNSLNKKNNLEQLLKLNKIYTQKLKEISITDYKILNSASLISLISISKNKKNLLNFARVLKAIFVFFPQLKFMTLPVKVMKIR